MVLVVGATGQLGGLITRRLLERGVDVVITTANAVGRGGADTVEAVDLAGNRALIDAARAAGVGQFIFVSALGSAPDSPVPFMRAKGHTEAHLRASGMPFAI